MPMLSVGRTFVLALPRADVRASKGDLSTTLFVRRTPSSKLESKKQAALGAGDGTFSLREKKQVQLPHSPKKNKGWTTSWNPRASKDDIAICAASLEHEI